MGQNGPFLGGLEGSKMSFLGPKPTQDPMNNVFEQKKSLGKIFFGPPGPPAAGGPKVVKIVPLGSLTLLKRSGTLYIHGKSRVARPVTPLAKVMTKTRFFGLPWGFWAVFGAGWGREYVVGLKTTKIPQNLKIREKLQR